MVYRKTWDQKKVRILPYHPLNATNLTAATSMSVSFWVPGLHFQVPVDWAGVRVGMGVHWSCLKDGRMAGDHVPLGSKNGLRVSIS